MPAVRLTALPPTGQLATLEAWLAFAEPLFARAGLALGQTSDNAHDEALYLFLRTLDWPLDSQPEVLARPLAPAQRVALRQMLHERVVRRRPAAYLTQETWLGGLRFHVDERVIVPRSYFVELLPELAALRPAEAPPPRRLADICTGSGCLALLLAAAYPKAEVDATDLSAEALAVAELNRKAHPALGRRVRLHQGDTLACLPLPASPDSGYDIILSNPPYEPSAHVDRQDPEFAAEPRLAHDGGPDGLVIVRRILREAAPRLAPTGILAVEIGGLRRAIDREFAALSPRWLETADGSNCVFWVAAAALRAWADQTPAAAVHPKRRAGETPPRS